MDEEARFQYFADLRDLCVAHLEDGELEQASAVAKRMYEEAQDYDERAAACDLVGAVAEEKEDFVEAIEAYQRWLQTAQEMCAEAPDDAGVKVELAQANSRLGEAAMAVEDWELALRSLGLEGCAGILEGLHAVFGDDPELLEDWVVSLSQAKTAAAQLGLDDLSADLDARRARVQEALDNVPYDNEDDEDDDDQDDDDQDDDELDDDED
ncbi:MAG: hypothetical protein R3B13_00265 [Polyangiaceae bacterium]